MAVRRQPLMAVYTGVPVPACCLLSLSQMHDN